MLIKPSITKEILDKYNIYIKGVLHVGAHKCEEKNVYNSWGISDENIIWVDANPELVIENKNKGILNCFCAALDETSRTAKFKITNNGESSSLLDLGIHKDYYPHIFIIQELDVRTQTLSEFINYNEIDITKYNLWNFDIQGSEFAVFKGSPELLKYADCIYVEVNTADVYKDCGKLDELDKLLNENQLTRVSTELTHANWGDAIYIRIKK